MQISNKSKETIDACRFCWMCRHICPIGNATGQERNTARARALSLSLVERDAAKLADVVDNIYECALCGACTKECATGWDPVKFTKETRLEAVLNGCMPDYIDKLISNFEAEGNIYGEKDIPSILKNEIDTLPKTADTLLFLGRDAIYKSADNAVKAIKLMKKAGVNFTVFANEPDSGYALDFLVGAADETKKTVENTAKKLNMFKTVVCYDPADAKMFLREYKQWGIALEAEPVTFTAFLAGLDLNLKKSENTYTLQDSALLARDLEDTQSARKLLCACGEIKEMLLFGKDTMLAGNLIMTEYMPDVMAKVASDRWVNAKRAGAETVVTVSPAEYEALKESQPDGIGLMTIEEVISQCL